ncbi:MAG: hypothetical protein HY666_04605 [Chloroflexi bacterium]|nr:hypothetical protein [Chloroflexota bacterium]
MRHLLYVPIIHGEADMGSAGRELSQKSAELLGQSRWLLHQKMVCMFWNSLTAFLLSLDPSLLRVYQDGLATDGRVGRRIVEEAAARGSQNYQLILQLLDRGAEIRKTENPSLLLREHSSLRSSLLGESEGQEQLTADLYLEKIYGLTKDRDSYIARSIGDTLKEGELGVLFIGAHHDVASLLPTDILVRMVKDTEKVRAYFVELTQGQDGKRLEELAAYLASPVEQLPN